LERSRKVRFRNTFERGILRLIFHFKHFFYRRLWRLISVRLYVIRRLKTQDTTRIKLNCLLIWNWPIRSGTGL
jgi:hypothetical protein